MDGIALKAILWEIDNYYTFKCSFVNVILALNVSILLEAFSVVFHTTFDKCIWSQTNSNIFYWVQVVLCGRLAVSRSLPAVFMSTWSYAFLLHFYVPLGLAMETGVYGELLSIHLLLFTLLLQNNTGSISYLTIPESLYLNYTKLKHCR